MSRLDRAVGLVRSLAIYHAIPFRQTRMKRLYTRLVEPGQLAFDIGAHVGNRSRALASLGCHVIALEPQPSFARLLRTLFARTPRVEVVEAAVAATAGRASLSVSERNPTVSTLAADWRAARAAEAGFGGVEWNHEIGVETTTLDRLIARYGRPTFIKIDVEGGEPAVLAGLSEPIRAVSFEYLPSALAQVRACVDRLAAIAGRAGDYRFNWSVGETFEWASEEWLDGDQLLEALSTPAFARRSGDVYALFRRAPPETRLRPADLAS